MLVHFWLFIDNIHNRNISYKILKKLDQHLLFPWYFCVFFQQNKTQFNSFISSIKLVMEEFISYIEMRIFRSWVLIFQTVSNFILGKQLAICIIPKLHFFILLARTLCVYWMSKAPFWELGGPISLQNSLWKPMLKRWELKNFTKSAAAAQYNNKNVRFQPFIMGFLSLEVWPEAGEIDAYNYMNY